MAASSGAGADDGPINSKADYMDSLATINKIRTRLGSQAAGIDIQLPQCVVAGDQSSGKSSLLEAFSGVPLPFGAGTQTRCPTEIDMHPLGPDSKRDDTKFMVQDKVTPKPEVIDAIRAAQVSILSAAGPAAASSAAGQFSTIPIRVEAHTIFPQRLTFLDMPGLHSDEDSGSATVKRMLQDQIASSRSLIIAVGEAGTDEARHESFQLAKNADSEGQRTIQVFTKCDVTDGKEANEMLLERMEQAAVQLRSSGKTARFAPHFVVARCGGVREGWSHVAEMAFFRDTLGVSSELLASGVIGITRLRERTEELLRDIVMTNVPKMRNEVIKKRKEYEARLRQIGPAPPPSTEVVRRCVDALKDAISELGQGTAKPTERFDSVATLASERHASDRDAVFAEVTRRMSPHDIPWFLAKFAFEKQLRTIGNEFGKALEAHVDAVMAVAEPRVKSSIRLVCSDEACLQQAFQRRLGLMVADALSSSKEALACSFKALARRNGSYYTRNAHHVDDAREVSLSVDAAYLSMVLPQTAAASPEELASALRVLQSRRSRPRDIIKQVVDRTMGDIASVAKAQLKEFLSAVNACVKEDVVHALNEWASGLVADVELRELAQETASRQREREQLKQQLQVAFENERDLAGLGLSGDTMLIEDAPTDDDGDDDAAASASSSAATEAAAKMTELEKHLQPAAVQAPRSQKQLEVLLKEKFGRILRDAAAGVTTKTGVDELRDGMELRDDEQIAFMAALRSLCHRLPAGGTPEVGRNYLMTTAAGELCIGMYKADEADSDFELDS